MLFTKEQQQNNITILQLSALNGANFITGLQGEVERRLCGPKVGDVGGVGDPCTHKIHIVMPNADVQSHNHIISKITYKEQRNEDINAHINNEDNWTCLRKKKMHMDG